MARMLENSCYAESKLKFGSGVFNIGRYSGEAGMLSGCCGVRITMLLSHGYNVVILIQNYVITK